MRLGEVTLAATMGALALALAAHGWPAWAAPPLEAYGRLPAVSQVRLSPDGARFALVAGPDAARRVEVREAQGLKLVAAAELGAVKTRELRWSGPSHLLVTVSETRLQVELPGPAREWLRVLAIDVRTGRLRTLLPSNPDVLNAVYDAPVAASAAGRPLAMLQASAVVGTVGPRSLHRIDLERGVGGSVLVEAGQPDTVDWLLDPEGAPVARADYEPRSGRWSLRLRRNGRWREAYSERAPIDQPSLAGFAEDGRSVLFSSIVDGAWAVRRLDHHTGALSEPIPGLEEGYLITDPVSLKPVGHVRQERLKTRHRFFAPEDQRDWTAVEALFPGAEVALDSMSDDRRRLVVRVSGVEAGAAFHLVELDGLRTRRLAEAYPDLAGAPANPMRIIDYPAGDGLVIPALLTLPADRPAERLPLVVLVHGGPAAQDEPGFDWRVQAIAGRGYAVLQPQFRGSTGMGRAFTAAGFGEWGRKMQTDLSDGVRRLVEDGVVDPARVCIVGASYGGYAALTAAMQEPDVWRCAVSSGGPSDLFRLKADERSASGLAGLQTLRFWDRFLGPGADLDALSPARHAQRIRAPVLLIHGEDDTTIPPEQSRVMADALARAGGEVRLVRLKGEDHWLSRGETRLEMLRELVGFLERRNPPGPGP